MYLVCSELFLCGKNSSVSMNNNTFFASIIQILFFQIIMSHLDVIVFWPEETSDEDYAPLEIVLKIQLKDQILVHSFHQRDDALKQFETLTKSSRPLVLITKLGKNADNSGEFLIHHIRHLDKKIFIILHSHMACNNPNIRSIFETNLTICSMY